jgi:hypothetical protein
MQGKLLNVDPRLAKTLKKANIHVTEDLSRRTRESRYVP